MGCAAVGTGPAAGAGPSIFHSSPDMPVPTVGSGVAAEAVLLRRGVPLPAQEAGAGVSVSFAGSPISLDVVDADLHDVLRLFGIAAELDFVVADDVQARVTLRLREVPWNHALVALLQRHGLVAAPVGAGTWRIGRTPP